MRIQLHLSVNNKSKNTNVKKSVITKKKNLVVASAKYSRLEKRAYDRRAKKVHFSYSFRIPQPNTTKFENLLAIFPECVHLTPNYPRRIIHSYLARAVQDQVLVFVVRLQVVLQPVQVFEQVLHAVQQPESK